MSRTVHLVYPVRVPFEQFDSFREMHAGYNPKTPLGGAFAHENDTIAYGLLVPFPGDLSHVAESVFLPMVDAAELRKYVPSLYGAVARSIARGVRENGYTRVQCHVFSDRTDHLQFATRVGFKTECELKGYGPGGRDMLIMRLVKAWQTPSQHRSSSPAPARR